MTSWCTHTFSALLSKLLFNWFSMPCASNLFNFVPEFHHFNTPNSRISIDSYALHFRILPGISRPFKQIWTLYLYYFKHLATTFYMAYPYLLRVSLLFRNYYSYSSISIYFSKSLPLFCKSPIASSNSFKPAITCGEAWQRVASGARSNKDFRYGVW